MKKLCTKDIQNKVMDISKGFDEKRVDFDLYKKRVQELNDEIKFQIFNAIHGQDVKNDEFKQVINYCLSENSQSFEAALNSPKGLPVFLLFWESIIQMIEKLYNCSRTVTQEFNNKCLNLSS